MMGRILAPCRLSFRGAGGLNNYWTFNNDLLLSAATITPPLGLGRFGTSNSNAAGTNICEILFRGTVHGESSGIISHCYRGVDLPVPLVAAQICTPYWSRIPSFI